jgi:starvation-inducible DNA-binding protein
MDDIFTALRKVQANYAALYGICKGAHWNVRGTEFYQQHLLFDRLADAFFEKIDPVAERIRVLGGFAPFDLGVLKSLADPAMPNPSEDQSPELWVQTVYTATQVMGRSLENANEVADELGDRGTENLTRQDIDDLMSQQFLIKAQLGM